MKSTDLGMAGLVSVLALLIASCQKEISSKDNGDTNTNCKLTKITSYDSTGAVIDTAGIYYANDKIAQVSMSRYYINLIYTNNRVTRINYFDPNHSPYDIFDSVTYNSIGKIESLLTCSTNTGTIVPIGGYVITYNGDGTPSKVIEKTSSPANGLEDSYEYQYTWSQQNVTNMTMTEISTSLILPLVYTSDNNTNYFNKFPAEYIFADNIQFGISGVQFGFFSPFLFNKNNIATIQGQPVTYEKDSKGNITAIIAGGSKLVSYAYTCQ